MTEPQLQLLAVRLAWLVRPRAALRNRDVHKLLTRAPLPHSRWCSPSTPGSRSSCTPCRSSPRFSAAGAFRSGVVSLRRASVSHSNARRYQAWAVYSLYAYLTVVIAKAEAEAAPSARSAALCRLFTLQYSAVQFCVSSAAFATTFARKYGDGAMRHDRAFFPLTIALNVSQALAIGSLAALAAAAGRVPQPAARRAGAKAAWLCLVIFGTYWQEMIIYALLRFSAVKASASWTLQSTSRSDVAHGMHAWLLCIEMAAAAAAFGAAFAPAESYNVAEGADEAQGVGFVTGLACAFGIATPPQAPASYDAEAAVSAAEVEADAEAEAKAERRRRREKRSGAPPSAEPSGVSFSDSARLDAAPPAEAAAAAEPMLRPPRERRRKPLPYALSAMPVVLAPPEPEPLPGCADDAPAQGVYSGILGWMGMGQPSHPYADEPPPVALPPPGMPLRVPVAVVHEGVIGVSIGPAPVAGSAAAAVQPPAQPPPPPVPPASETLTELIAKMTLQVKGAMRP